MFTMQTFRPAFFRGETLSRDSPTLVTEESLARGDSNVERRPPNEREE